MGLWHKRLTGLSMVAVVGWVAAGCGVSKVAQCNDLIEATNTAWVTPLQEITAANTAGNTDVLLQMADLADSAVPTIQAVELTDEQLVTYQTQYVEMVTATGTANRSIHAALSSQDNAAAQEALSALEAASSQEDTIVNDINTYCGATTAQPES